MAVRVGINGFGRIGRLAFRAARVSDHHGVGFAEVAVHDGRGRCGRALQSLLANPR